MHFLLTIAPPMTGFDMTSPSISGHHKISLKDGSILFSTLTAVLEELGPLGPEFGPPWLIPKATELPEDVVEAAAIASVAIFPSLKNNKKILPSISFQNYA